MTEETAAYTVTLKSGPGYEAPWLVVRGDTAEQVKDLLKGVWEANLGGAVIATASALHSEYQTEKQGGNAVPAVVAATGGTVVAETPTYSAPTPTPAPSAPPVQAAAPDAAPTCQHGAMSFKSGTSAKTGRAWQAWFCPTPKGTPGQCDPKFV